MNPSVGKSLPGKHNKNVQINNQIIAGVNESNFTCTMSVETAN